MRAPQRKVSERTLARGSTVPPYPPGRSALGPIASEVRPVSGAPPENIPTNRVERPLPIECPNRHRCGAVTVQAGVAVAATTTSCVDCSHGSSNTTTACGRAHQPRRDLPDSGISNPTGRHLDPGRDEPRHLAAAVVGGPESTATTGTPTPEGAWHPADRAEGCHLRTGGNEGRRSWPPVTRRI